MAEGKSLTPVLSPRGGTLFNRRNDTFRPVLTKGWRDARTGLKVHHGARVVAR
jgi:hypothetical protein